MLLADLAKKYNAPKHDLIIEEFGCNSARADVAVVNGSLHAFEIKSAEHEVFGRGWIGFPRNQIDFVTIGALDAKNAPL